MNIWRRVAFDEVVSDETGGNLKTLQSDFASVGTYPIIDQGKDLIAGYTDDPKRLCKIQSPVIVFGDHTKAVKYVDFPFCLGADGTKILCPTEGLNAKFLYQFLRTVTLPEAGYSRHFKYLRRIELPLPPIEEQRRIAAILDQAEALRAKRRAALAQLDGMAQAIFVEMFGDLTVNPKAWPLHQIGGLGVVHTGKTPPTQREGMFGGAIPFATPGDLDSGLEHTERTLTESGACFTRVVRSGSALVGCIGNIGKMAKALQPTAFNQQINAIEWSNEVDDDFGIAALAFAKAQMLARSASTTVPILNKSAFCKIEIAVPPIHLQKAYAARLPTLMHLRIQQRAALESLDSLFSSLQHRAFRGEL